MNTLRQDAEKIIRESIAAVLPVEAVRRALVAMGPFVFSMINPVITKKTGEYQTEESCLSLGGVRPCTRYKEIEVDYLDQDFQPKHGK